MRWFDEPLSLGQFMGRITVHLFGRAKDSSARALIDDYSSRIKGRGISMVIHPNKLDNGLYEKKLSKLAGDLFLLDETGMEYTSIEFAELVKNLSLATETAHFAIGPADGFGEEIKELAKGLLSLSTLTMPHELASVIMLEQLYRATEINRGSPYHRE